MCMKRFVGRGYSEEFVSNMRRVISALKAGETFVLTDKADNICRACPYNTDGICRETDKVKRYDNAIKNVLNLEYGKEYKYNDLCKTDISIKEICGDCEWAKLCEKINLEN